MSVLHTLKGEPTVLVAGGAGFLGSHLCEKLLEPCRVICLDNLRFGKRENLRYCLRNEKFTFIEYDIAKPLHDLLRKRVDYIFHVAGVDEVERRQKASLEDLLLNSYGTRNLLEKALLDKARFLLVSTHEHRKQIDETITTAQARLFSESLTAEYIKNFGLNARIVRVGHLFGPRMPLDTQNPMGILMKALLHYKDPELKDAQTEEIYPVYVGDCVELIVNTMFDAQTKGRIFNLLPNEPMRFAQLLHIVKQAEPKSQITKQIEHTISLFTAKEAMEPPPKKGPPAKKRKRAILFIALALLASTILPVLLFLAASLMGVISLNGAQGDLQTGRLKEAKRKAMFANKSFQIGESFLILLSPHFIILNRQKNRQDLAFLLRSGSDASLALSQFARASLFFADFFTQSMNGELSDIKPTLNLAISQLTVAARTTALLTKQLEDISSLSLPKTLVAYTQEKGALLAKQQETVSLIQTLAAILPDLLGFDGKRVYLVLFQNNMELRPAGGFIGSYGIVSFEKGRLLSFDIFDVYDADGQLKGHVDPPLPIRKYLKQPNWFLRDSNWDPDFQKSAQQVSWFLEKETGQGVHGVIAIDVSFAKLLVSAIGPISLPDYKETITASNLFEKTQTHVESGSFAGSTQKKDFLGVLARQLIDRLLHDENIAWLSILQAVERGLLEKHALFSFNNEVVQKVFTVQNLGGTILTFEEKEGTFHDFRMIIEANLGVNKANFFVKREVSDELTIGEKGEVTGTLSITYANEGQATWPGGPYDNYLRTLWPLLTEITSVTIDGEEVLKNPDFGIDLDEATQSGLPGEQKTMFGFFVTIAPQSRKTIAISYTLPQPLLLLPGSNTYAYVFQKQPGTLEDPLHVNIRYPKELRMKSTNAQVFYEEQVVALATDTAEDRLFEVEFVK